MATAASYGVWAEAQARRAWPTAPVDGAIVFYANDATGDRERLSMALRLWREGAADSLYFVGGARSSGSWAARQARIAVSAGVAPERVGSDLASFDTETNVASACAAIGRSQWGRVVLVSDAMHIVRIRYLLQRSACAAVPTFAAPTPSPNFAQTWRRAHYEALAWAVDVLLPRSVRTWLLHLLRP
jgi:uncharacterized SAM-binding protein YcdF (DUF218 family)